jgi:2-polyprenyl-3-methyl-5-hydroxy-6-metoxy-1,4-benzoquinol methylase
VAAQFIVDRERTRIGAGIVRTWGRDLPVGATVLDLGCGSGVPVSEALIEMGHQLFGIDASATLIAAYQKRFVSATAGCESVETSLFFGRKFDGVVAIGLLFLLEPEVQRLIVRKVGEALAPGGRFLFTAPQQACEWQDISTGRRSRSLGVRSYRSVLAEAGMRIERTSVDDGENHYIEAECG